MMETAEGSRLQNPLQTITALISRAQAEGVSVLRVGGIIANEDLPRAMDLAARRFGGKVVTDGTTTWLEIPVK